MQNVKLKQRESRRGTEWYIRFRLPRLRPGEKRRECWHPLGLMKEICPSRIFGGARVLCCVKRIQRSRSAAGIGQPVGFGRVAGVSFSIDRCVRVS